MDSSVRLVSRSSSSVIVFIESRSISDQRKEEMARPSSGKVKIGVHWKNSVPMGLSSPVSSLTPRHPKLIELDPNVPLNDYISTICDDWKIPQSNLVHFALRYDDTHKFVTEQTRSQIPTGQVFYLSLSHEDEVQDILKSLLSTDYHRYDSTVLERLKLAAEDETFALEFVQQKGLEHLLRLFSNEERAISYEHYSSNLLRSLHNILTNQAALHWDDLGSMDAVIDQLISGVNASKTTRLHSSSAMMILHSILNHGSKYSTKIIQSLDIQCLLDYCSKHHDLETQFYSLALINVIMSKGGESLRSCLVTAMSYSFVSVRLRELVQSVITSGDEHSINESFSHTESTAPSARPPLTRSSVVQQLCLLQRFYLNEIYTPSMNTVPNRSDIKSRDMIAELRRSAFDTDLLLPGQSCQDLPSKMSSMSSNDSLTPTNLNPRRVEALQRDYERLGFQDLREPIKDFQHVPPGVLSLQNLFYFCIHQKNDFIRFVLENSCKTLQQQCPLVKSAIEITQMLCKLFCIGVEPNIHQVHKDYFLLFYVVSSFFEQAFVRSLLLFNKTWKEMRACDVDFQVVSQVVQQQISQSLNDISLVNASASFHNRTLVSPHTSSINASVLSPVGKSAMNFSFTSSVLQRFTFDYFSERLNVNNYKDICRRRDESEAKREESLMRLPIVDALKDRLRLNVEAWTRQARMQQMKKGQVFMTVETRPGAKKNKNRLMYWQLLDNEKNLQCSESSSTSTKETNTRDSSAVTTTSLTRTMIPLESIKEVLCHIDPSRTSLSHASERGPKLIRHSNSHASVTVVLLNETNYTLLCENDYDMACWSDGFNILLHKEIDSFYARQDMESLLNLLCQLQMLELDNPSIVLPQHPLSVPIRLPPTRSATST